MSAHDLVHGASKTLAGAAPAPNLDKLKIHFPTQRGGSKVLMGNCVPPFVEQVEIHFPAARRRIMDFHFIPEIDSQSAKVSPKAARLRVPAIQLATSGELGPYQAPQC